MISELLRQLTRTHLTLMIGFVLMTIVSGVAIFVSRIVVDALSLSDTAGMLVLLGCFIILLVAGAWAYDKYKDWQFFQKQD